MARVVSVTPVPVTPPVAGQKRDFVAAGGFEPSAKRQHVGGPGTIDPTQAKKALNEMLARRQFPAAQYTHEQCQGNEQQFRATVHFSAGNGTTQCASAVAVGKKEAERLAAVEALRAMGQLGTPSEPPPAYSAAAGASATEPQPYVSFRSEGELRQACMAAKGQLQWNDFLWVFLHDELMWELPQALGIHDYTLAAAAVTGYERRLCLWDNYKWGTARCYGLSCGLVHRQGAPLCSGLAYQIPARAADGLFRTCMATEGTNWSVARVSISEGEQAGRQVRALVFTTDVNTRQYAQLEEAEIGNVVAGAMGPAGANIKLLHLLSHELCKLGSEDAAVGAALTAANDYLWGSAARLPQPQR